MENSINKGENYILLRPQFIIWLGIIDVALFSFILVLVCTANGNGAFGTSIVLSVFIILGVILIVYGGMWKIIVNKDILTVCLPFRNRRIIRLSEITRVKQTDNRLLVYVGDKQAFTVDNIVSKYNVFCVQLYRAVKTETKTLRREFVVKQRENNIVIGIIGTLFFSAVLLFAAVNGVWVVSTISFFMVTLAIYLLVKTLTWKITVHNDTITVKKMLGSEKEYHIRDITKLIFNKEDAALYIQDKKIVNVAYNCEYFSSLIDRLKSET